MHVESAPQRELIRAVVEKLEASRAPLAIAGLWGSSAPMLAATLAHRTGRAFLYVTAHAEQADVAADSLETFGGQRPDVLPAWELKPGEGAAADEVAAERTRLCAGLHDAASGPHDRLHALRLVAPVQALMQPVPTSEALDRNALVLTVRETRDPRAIAEWLAERGFTRLDQVEQPGDFALRGGILDIFV